MTTTETTTPTVERTGTATVPRPRPSRGMIVSGVAVVIVGALWLLDVLDVWDVRMAAVIPGILAALGVALIVGALEGRNHVGIVVAGVFVTLLTLAAAVTPPDAFEGGVGYRDIRVTDQVELAERYYLGVGDMRLDLSDLALTQSRQVSVSVGAGELIVLLPEGVTVTIDAVARAGQVDLLGDSTDGVGATLSYTSDGFDSAAVTLTLDLNVTAGNIEVDR